jgi:hypothetical protein
MEDNYSAAPGGGKYLGAKVFVDASTLFRCPPIQDQLVNGDPISDLSHIFLLI